MKTETSKKCRVKGCKRHYLINGLCCFHYLKQLDAFEKASRKANLIVTDK